MKKLLALVLSVMLIFSLAVTVWAAQESIPSEGKSFSKDVTVTYEPGEETIIYSVDIVWGSTEIKYSDADKTWNPETHSYTEASAGFSYDGTNSIIVKNHSNAKIGCSVNYAPLSTYEDKLYLLFDPDAFTIESAVGSDAENPPYGITTFSLDVGNFDMSSLVSTTKIGTITLTIQASY